jgi:hypothetical protein
MGLPSNGGGKNTRRREVLKSSVYTSHMMRQRTVGRNQAEKQAAIGMVEEEKGGDPGNGEGHIEEARTTTQERQTSQAWEEGERTGREEERGKREEERHGTVLEPFKTLVLWLTLQSIRTCRIRDSKNTKQCCSTTPEII